MTPRCQTFFGPYAITGANLIYAGAKKEAAYAYRTNTHANNIAKA